MYKQNAVFSLSGPTSIYNVYSTQYAQRDNTTLAITLVVTVYSVIKCQLNCSKCSWPYWSNPPFLISDIQALWRSRLSARMPEYQQIKNGGLDQYGAERFGRLIFAILLTCLLTFLSFRRRHALQVECLHYIKLAVFDIKTVRVCQARVRLAGFTHTLAQNTKHKTRLQHTERAEDAESVGHSKVPITVTWYTCIQVFIASVCH